MIFSIRRPLFKRAPISTGSWLTRLASTDLAEVRDLTAMTPRSPAEIVPSDSVVWINVLQSLTGIGPADFPCGVRRNPPMCPSLML